MSKYKRKLNIKWFATTKLGIEELAKNTDFSFFIFYYNQNAFKVKKIINCFFIFNIFILFITITSFIYSSYPITAVFKIISYYIPFLSIIIGIYFTDNNKFSVIINRYLSLIVFFSVFLFFSPLGYFRNGIFFQGLTNHPNLFAIIIPLFIANYLYLNYDKFSKIGRAHV